LSSTPASDPPAYPFRVERVPASMAASFVRSAGLTPLRGRVEPDDIGWQTLEVVKKWRDRVAKFAAWGLVTPRQAGFMRNCGPAFAVCKPQTRFCRQIALCPFCAARAALPTWQAIDGKLFGPQATKISVADLAPAGRQASRALEFEDDDADLEVAEVRHDGQRLEGTAMIVRALSIVSPFEPPYGLAPLLVYRFQKAPTRRPRARLPSRTTEIRRFGRLGVTGGIDATHVRFHLNRSLPLIPTSDGKRVPTDGWQVTFSQVMFVPTAKASDVMDNMNEVPKLPKGIRGMIDLNTIVEPARYDVLNAMAHAMRYSIIPWRGCEKVVREYLEARQRRHMTVTFGALCGK
jgi:hypothetical protein